MSYMDDAGGRRIRLVKAIEKDPKILQENKRKAQDYVNFMIAKGLVERTIVKNLYCFSTYLKAIGNKPVMKVKKIDVERAVAIVERSSYSDKSKQNIKVSIKQFYKHFMGDDEVYPREVSWIKTSLKSHKRILPEDILTEDDVLKMLEAAPNVRDKAIIALLYDSGCRMGEIMSLKIKDINLAINPAHIVVNGKTGMRQIPIMFSVPFLAIYLNTVKEKDRAAWLWSGLGSHTAMEKIDYGAIRMMIKRVAGLAKIKKRVYPHLFRHSRASYYANKLTEQQLKAFFGWTGDSRMASTYVHLSGRDIDNAIMQANGLEVDKTITEPKLKAKLCMRCQFSNTVDSIYCNRCGAALDIGTAMNLQEAEDKLKKSAKVSYHDPKLVEEIVHEYLMSERERMKKSSVK